MTTRKHFRKRCACGIAAIFLLQSFAGASAGAYVLNYTVADARDPRNTPYSACPAPQRFNVVISGIVDRRWSTSLGTSPIKVFTSADDPNKPFVLSDKLNEIEQSIQNTFSVWTHVSGTTLTPAALGTLARTATQNACSISDGLNSICFNQTDGQFTSGVLAFARVVTSDILGEQPFPANPPAAFTGEILDADIFFNPSDPTVSFATPAALAAHANSWDLESILMHELGHFFGFSHSGVWGAMMYPFAPPSGQVLVDRPTVSIPDSPLADDDRAGLRVLYPDPSDAIHTGSIRGRILPLNPLALAGQANVNGIFGAHVVAVDDATGAVVAATLAGWTCSGAGPPQFGGSYVISKLAVGKSYKIYAEPLDGPVSASDVSTTTSSLCRNATTDPGWPAQFACTVPAVNPNFTTRVKP